MTSNNELFSQSASLPPNAIAVVGMAGRFPGADSVSAFWDNLRRGEESIVTLSEEHLLAAGIGARALVKDVLPQWIGKLTGTVLIIFAAFCLIAAVWREIRGTPRSPEPDIRMIPAALLVPMNILLLIVVVAALVGIWSAKG